MEFKLEGDRFVSVPVSEWVTSGCLIAVGPEKQVMLVHKVNPKNYVCYDEAGQCWNVRIAGQKPLPRDTPFDRTAYQKKMQERSQRDYRWLTEAVESRVTLGTIVEFTNPRDRAKFPGHYVVCIVPNARAMVRAAKIGGDGGRYVNAPVSSLRVVPVEDVLK